MKALTVTTFLVVSVFAASQSQANELASLRKCYKDIQLTSHGMPLFLENDLLMLPGIKKGEKKRGFYIYTDRTSYFCEFPDSPQVSNDFFNYYYLQLKVEDSPVEYITYSDPKNSDRSSIGIATAPRPLDALLGKYKQAKCQSYLTDETRNELKKELDKRISTVYNAYRSNKLFERERANRQVDAAKYFNSLDNCMKIPGLADAVQMEKEKFIGPPAPKTNNGKKTSGAGKIE